ncbi:MAG: serine hydrolase [Patescibacteria group bacterium]
MGKIAKSGPRAGLLIGYEVWQLPNIQTALLKQIYTRAALACLIFFGSVIVIQLVYPVNRALPLSKFADINLGFSTSSAAAVKITSLNDRQLSVSVGEKTVDISLAEIGLAVNELELASKLTDYPLSRRLIPFSILSRPSYSDVTQTKVVNETILKSFTTAIASSSNTQAKEGSIINKNGKLSIVAPVAGRNYTHEAIAQYFSIGTDTAISGHAVLAYQSSVPTMAYDQLQSLSKNIQNFASTDFLVRFGQSSIKIPAADLLKSISFTADPKSGTPVLSLSRSIIEKSLEKLANSIFTPPTASSVGQELDIEKSMVNIQDAAISGLDSTTVVAKSIAPRDGPVYPATSLGIQQIIDEWRTIYRWVDVAVDFQQIDGSKTAGLDDGRLFFSASVYKSLVAWRVLTEAEEGRLDPTKPLVGGKNLDECLEEMIVVSASNCAEGVVKKYGGYTALDNFINQHEISGIQLSRGLSVSADGMRQFLHKLHGEKLMNKSGTDKLISYMKRQNYRKGIPAGSAGEVADKVGYNPRNPSWHDAAIVYHPKSTYSLVVLTASGGQFPMIADLAKQISDTLSR